MTLYPSTHIVVACLSDRRWFDLDAVRTPAQQPTPAGDRSDRRTRVALASDGKGDPGHHGAHEGGAPPLDWCEDDPEEPLPARAEGKEPMTARLLVGDVRDRIREIPDGSIDLVCTSPPFLALRKYGDNDAEMGSEANPAAFIDALLELTAEFRRVLAPHGSIAIELGDTYSGAGGYGSPDSPNPAYGDARFVERWEGRMAKRYKTKDDGWPLSKSLAGIPHAYMLSLAYGWNVLRRNADDSPAGRWRVRNMIVWARPNPPVGALGDKVRPATSYITVGCVSDRRWFDLDAVRTEHKADPSNYTGNGYSKGFAEGIKGNEAMPGNPAGAPPLDWCEDDDPTYHATLILPTAPYPGAHYATWPPTLAKRLIEMMCPIRVCLVCGEPPRRIVEAERFVLQGAHGSRTRAAETPPRDSGRSNSTETKAITQGFGTAHTTLGWTDCGHDNWRQGHVLDPFAGSGTTLAVAHGCGRDATGIELYTENANLIADRLGMFLEVVP